MAQRHYQDQFRLIIDCTAWPGTLNVHVDGENLIKFKRLRVSAGIEKGQRSDCEFSRIQGFVRDGVSFGGATAFKGTIKRSENQIECAVLIPDLTRHEDVVEVISGSFLREGLSLLDGDEVEIHLSK